MVWVGGGGGGGFVMFLNIHSFCQGTPGILFFVSLWEWGEVVCVYLVEDFLLWCLGPEHLQRSHQLLLQLNMKIFKGTVSQDEFFCSKARLHSRSGSSLFAQCNWYPDFPSNIFVKMLCEKSKFFLNTGSNFLGYYVGPSAVMEASLLPERCQNNFFLQIWARIWHSLIRIFIPGNLYPDLLIIKECGSR